MSQSRLSRLQRWILIEAHRGLATVEERAQKIEEGHREFVPLIAEVSDKKPQTKYLEPVDRNTMEHLTRLQILTGFFALPTREDRPFQIAAQAAGAVKYNKASASCYRSLRRLEERDLLVKRDRGYRLTAEGVRVATLISR
jgi:hypothetical protein